MSYEEVAEHYDTNEEILTNLIIKLCYVTQTSLPKSQFETR